MKPLKFLLLLPGFLSVLLSSCQTNSDRLILGREHAEKSLISALADSNLHNVVQPGSIIVKDSASATAIAETILFGIYGEENIKHQRPYQIYHLQHYWVLSGTLKKGRLGGTFQLILDERNSQVIRITHGK